MARPTALEVARTKVAPDHAERLAPIRALANLATDTASGLRALGAWSAAQAEKLAASDLAPAGERIRAILDSYGLAPKAGGALTAEEIAAALDGTSDREAATVRALIGIHAELRAAHVRLITKQAAATAYEGIATDRADRLTTAAAEAMRAADIILADWRKA